MNVDDAHAHEPHDAIAKILAHPADLPVHPLGEDNAEFSFVQFLNLAWPCERAKNRHPSCHPSQEAFRDSFVYRHNIFFFMEISGLENLIPNLPIICHQQQALGFLVQPPHRIDPFGIIQIIDDVIFFPFLRGAHDPFWFVKCQNYFFILPADCLAVHSNILPFAHGIPEGRDLPIDANPSFFHHAVSRPARTYPRLAQIFIDPYSFLFHGFPHSWAA